MEITIKDIANSGLTQIPLEIKSLGKGSSHNALITAAGEIEISGKRYSSLDSAMEETLMKQPNTVSSNGWQFWGFYSEEREAWTPLEHLRARLASSSKQSEIRTSDTHPLRVDKVDIPGYSGRLGLTFCPGKRSEGLYGGTWERNLKKDLAALEDEGTAMLISLMEEHEFALLGVPEFPEVMGNSPIQWLHLPIQDMSTPTADFEAKWEENRPEINKLLNQGRLIVIHCRGGLGRTGLLAARLLVEAGMAPSDAVNRVKSARENAIETYGQEEYVLNRAWEECC